MREVKVMVVGVVPLEAKNTAIVVAATEVIVGLSQLR